MNIHNIYRVFMGRFRPARMAAIRAMFPLLEEDGTVLDLGGTATWWRDMGVKTHNITVVNLDERQKAEVLSLGYQFTYANACQLPYPDASFDLTFSNSVIEHVGGKEEQIKFAKELLRCGKAIYLQTPNKWFPVEPHLITLFVHWLPFDIQRHLVRWCSIWGWVTRPDQETIDRCIRDIKLLTRTEIKSLFPECKIESERVLGLTKSFIVTKTDGPSAA